jgi:ribose 5-phosphate isomerase B
MTLESGFGLAAKRKVVIGADDVYPAAREAVRYLASKGFEVELVGSLVTERVEPWPDVAFEVARRVAEGQAEFGVVVCHTGTGVFDVYVDERLVYSRKAEGGRFPTVEDIAKHLG